MNMKKIWIIVAVIIIIGIIAFLGFKWFGNNNNNNSSEYNATRTATNNQNNQNEQAKSTKAETELYSFSTPIKSSDENRLTNIKITCSRINETTVKAGKEFSFCDVVGQPSSDDGYKPADAFGSDGEIIKAIGGGNCQVSTTIYNAALGTPRIKHNRKA